ncbi:hypothetical protein V8C44DRAFT_169767 [Trichoderma aethiopicum]
MGETAPSALNHLHVMPSESESTERASRQASVKVVRVTVNNHLGDPAKTVSNCAGRLLRLEGCLSCLEECDSSHARVQQSAASQRDGLTLISASRVTAGAPAKACWYLCDGHLPPKLCEPLPQWRGGFRNFMAKRHTSHSRSEAMGRPLVPASCFGQNFRLWSGVCQRVAAVNGRSSWTVWCERGPL